MMQITSKIDGTILQSLLLDKDKAFEELKAKISNHVMDSEEHRVDIARRTQKILMLAPTFMLFHLKTDPGEDQQLLEILGNLQDELLTTIGFQLDSGEGEEEENHEELLATIRVGLQTWYDDGGNSPHRRTEIVNSIISFIEAAMEEEEEPEGGGNDETPIGSREASGQDLTPERKGGDNGQTP